MVPTNQKPPRSGLQFGYASRREGEGEHRRGAVGQRDPRGGMEGDHQPRVQPHRMGDGAPPDGRPNH